MGMFSFGGKKKSKARDKKKEKGGDKDKEAALGYDEEDGYGEEIYDEGALEMLADEGIDSDIEAEENERYNRRPRPADGPVERSTENGFLARQPCRAALVAPTSHTTGYNAHEKPDHHLQLDFVYGYRAHDSRHNLVYNIDGLVTYPAAATGIAYDSREHTQQFFTMHTDDIVSLAMHPDREIMATGQVGKDPTICVWSSTTCELLAELKGFHQRAVVSLSFDGTGKYLASVGLDDDHSVAIYDWASRRMVANSKGDENRVFNCEYNPYDGRLVTGGVKHIKFWVMEGGYLVGKRGVYGRMGAVSTILSIAFHTDGSTLTGTQGGIVYQWADGGEQCIQKFEALHQGPVHDIFVNEDYIVTGGKDGKVNFFTQYMEKVFTIDMAKVVETITDLQGKPLCSYDGKAPCVKSLFMEGTQLLVGTKGSEIFEFDMSTEDSWKTRRRIITQGHSAGYDEKRRIQTSELWGLTTHPFLPQFVSAGDDKTLRVYDMYQRRQIAVRNVSSKVRSASYSPDGKFIAAGFFGGGFIVFDTNTGNELVAKKHRRECIGDIKFSPSGRWLAVGSHDNFVDVYDASRNFKRVGVCKGHSSYITHLDWSEDSRYLQTNSGDYELMFWEIPGCEQVKFPTALKDTKWDSWTSTLGWPVQGVWPKHADGTDVNACCRSADGTVVATADDFGLVKLFRYPSDVGRADYHGYLGHSSHVTNARFSYNDEFLITVGGGDRCAFQWRHYEADEGDEEMTSEVEEEVLTSVEDYEDFSKTNQVVQMVMTGHVNGIPQYMPLSSLEAKPSREIPQGSGLDPGSRLAFLPCAPAVFAPDGYLREPDALAPCMEAAELEFVHGYRAHDTRDNLFYTARGEVVYHTASLGIVYNRESNTQRFLADNPTVDGVTGHTDDVLCCARHPTGSIFATGEVGRNPKLIVWSSDDPRRPLAILQGFLKKAIVSATFSRDGTLLCAVGADANHSLAVYRWQTGTMLASSKGSPEKIVSVSWSPFQDYVVTCGVKHLMFWSTSPFVARKALFSKRGKIQTMLCCCFPGPDTTVVGTQDGSLYLFKGYQLATNMRRCHQVTHAVSATRDVVISGGKEGKVKFWTIDLMQCLKEVEINHPQAMSGCIKAMHLSGSMLVVGIRTGEIYEMDTTSYTYTLMLQGHGYGTIWGLATHPGEHQMCTVGDDCTVRVWDVASRRMVMVRDLGAKGRSVAYHPDGSQIAIGLAGGGLVVLSADSLDTIHAKKDREEPIHELKYSPNGQYLGVGSHDNYIDVYDVGKQYGRMGVAKGHASYIRHIDWSEDSTVMQSNSGDFEMLFWEMPSGKQIKFPADTRNMDWATWTCVAGWPVQGILPRYSMGTDVTTCDRSHTRTVVASGDQFGMLNMYQYPAHKGCAGRTFGAHSAKVTQVRFMFDDTYLVTVGADMTLCQWRIVL